jgi:methyl-accepting chemotaxis protein
VNKTSIRRGRTLSIRTRVLSIALVPCFVFLLAGAGSAGYLIYDAATTRDYFDQASQTQRAALPLIVSLEEERRLTLPYLSTQNTARPDLVKQRQATDALFAKVTPHLEELAGVAPDSVIRDIRELDDLMRELPELRTRADDNRVTVNETFNFYNRIVDQFVEGLQGLAQFGPEAESVYQLSISVGPLLSAADQMQRADALAAANLAGGLTREDRRTYQTLVGAYHLQLEHTMALLEPTVRAQYAKLKESPAWRQLTSVEVTLLDGGNQLPVSVQEWRLAAKAVSTALMGMLTIQARATIADAVSSLDTTLTQSIIAGAVVLLLAAAVFVFALRLSRRLIDRLTRLRTETLDLAEKKLPELVEKVRTGADVAVEDSVRLVNHGSDEIGEVANAFNKAQQTAVTAAVQEARTREGTKTVFLNIARRSQVIVHRQLKVLDEAERRQEDPEQLEMLFQLDHLSTRARRNAENLIILGGGQPGRRWRNPVSLTELARGAAAETEDFARVKIAKLPPVGVNGPVVGDLVHLLAELIDNATSFSPPQSRVDVRGNVVGRGVVLEVEDQGLGIEPERVEAFNEMLRRPPDFGIMALSDEPRLGLFVVARLSARHGISVTLRESAYGGTRAIVLVRAELLTEVAEEPAPPVTTTSARPAPSGTATVSLPVSLLPVSSLPASSLPASFLQPLPAFPAVEAKPGENLFRPQRPVPHTPEPDPPRRSPMPRQPAAGRPALPQRRRQQNLAAQLKEEPEPTWPKRETAEDTPDAARSRLSAFVQGTRRGREEPGFTEPGFTEPGFTEPGSTEPEFENTNGNGVRNGQHRAE